VANFNSDSVSVIDTATNTVVDTVGVADSPLGVAITPDAAKVYVTNPNVNKVSVIDTETNTMVTTINVGTSPRGIAISPDGARAYAVNHGSNTISVIDTATDTVATTIGVGGGPWAIAITPDGAHGYVTNFSSDSVSVIDTATNTVGPAIGVGDRPRGIAISQDGARAYVTSFGSNTVSVIDIATNTVATTIGVGVGPIGIAMTPDGNRAYVANADSFLVPPTVSVIDTTTNTVVDTVGVGHLPLWTAVTPDGALAYVTNSGPDTVSVIDTSTNTVVNTVGVGDRPWGIAISPPVLTADAGPDITITNLDQETTIIQGTASDPEGDPMTYRWLEGATELLGSTAVSAGGEAPLDLSTFDFFSLGDHTLTLEVTDGTDTDTDEMILTVVSAADAGPDLTITNLDQATTIIQGTASDFDGDSLTYRWLEGATELLGSMDVGAFGEAHLDLSTFDFFSLGDHTLTLEVSDGKDTVTDDMVLTIVPVPVAIDILPGVDTNRVILCSRGAIPVAIFGAADLDVNDIVVQTVQLAGSGVKARGDAQYLFSIKDVNNDGFTDLVVYIEVEDLDPAQIDVSGEVALTSELSNGAPIEGTGFVTLVREDCPRP
jgi:YVTN family beta-propeller protein